MAEEQEPRLIVETEPDPEDIRALEECLYDFNVQATGIADGNPLAVFLRGPDGHATGGVHGWTWGDTCYVRLLYLPADMRNRGHGTRLMAIVEQEAVARGCGQILLETHDFQAPALYRKLGFAVVGTVDDYPRGHRYLTMLKRLR